MCPDNAQSTTSAYRSSAGQWHFDNSYLGLPGGFYTCLNPVAVREPKLLLFNQSLADQIGLGFLGSGDQALDYFAGNAVPPGTTAFAQAYAGHQFGGFSMLGDGRAVVLGEQITPDGKRVDLQLKGSGPTPYSRRGDGRAALAPMLREYLISEAMHYLGIPTTRSLAVVSTGEPVFRQGTKPGGVLTRVAASHLRVGTFQYAAAKGDVDNLRALLMYAIRRHYPELEGFDNPALALLQKVMDMQATLIVHWMRVGFIHGVMNTDNMTISGETIDYGPCAFMNRYDRETVFSSIDHQGRYAFGNQPGIAQWNLLRLAEALLPLIDDNEDKAIEIVKETVGQYATLYTSRFELMMLNKLGITHKIDESDEQLISDLLDWMTEAEVDYTNTFRELAQAERLLSPVYSSPKFKDWHARWKGRLNRQSEPLSIVRDLMNRTNPAYIPRNHLVEHALAQAEREMDLEPFNELLAVLSNPYEEQAGKAAYTDPGEHDPGYMTFCGT
ncbi:MAG: YdiU family protein [Burkholderiaceae bacterium]|nr:YdiU family protein [Burkholderiaceae bacterium]MCD8516891.1 YdiU family protein [Burkholderiaceae bacterium]MCD8537591.1 YdiU family protein [Burkholderiaceae bacterium]MCD8565600.1 YdiU family protein [Burkholderiaceae bacterium]